MNYRKIDGREDHESFRDCITTVVEELKVDEGIHVIMDFEPVPLYKMMASKGFDKRVEKISDEEFHVYFYKTQEIEMTEHLEYDENKIKEIVAIKVDFLTDKISFDEAKKRLNDHYDVVTSKEFALCEQYLVAHNIPDELVVEKMEPLVALFDGLLQRDGYDLEDGHPIKTYLNEVVALRDVLKQMRTLLSGKFIKNQWLEQYEKLSEINTHFARKQNQLYPVLETKGFDRPSKVMWTLENEIRGIIKEAFGYLRNDQDEAFVSLQNEVIDMVEDMMVKEEEILYPTALDLISDEAFVSMRISDDEIGYCLIDTPKPYGKKEQVAMPQSELLKDLAGVLAKHGISNNNDVLDVSQGKLTLEQVNLIFKHLQVDLSYVDENEVVKFYSDTKHRIFPRSAGVIGRKVQNCHPRESVDTVEKIISAFRSGEQDRAEFWLEIGGKFIYIIYNAVRDESGKFRGVLEMMQDVTHIRALEGSQRLLSWDTEKDSNESVEEEEIDNEYGITKDTVIGDLVKAYPFVKDFLLTQSPKFKKLKNPVLFKTMSSMATIEMISNRGNLDLNTLISNIVSEIKQHS